MEIISESPKSRVFKAREKNPSPKMKRSSPKKIKSFTKASLSSTPEALNMFINELTVLQVLSDCPSFNKIEEIYESASSFFLVLEYIEGDVLADIGHLDPLSDT